MSFTASRIYRLAGVDVCVADPENILDDALDPLFGDFAPPMSALEGPSGPTISVEVRSSSRPAQPPPENVDLRMVFDREAWGVLVGDRLVVSDGRVFAEVRYADDEIHFSIHRWDDATRFTFVHHLFPLTVAEALRTKGRHALHGAALELPDGGGALLLGDSGAGKTTLGYRASSIGCRWIADDGLLLTEGDGSGDVVAHPFYREPSLDPALLRPEDRDRARPLAPSLDGPRLRLPDPRGGWASSCSLSRILLLGPRRGAARSLRRSASAAEVLAELVRQNRRVMLVPRLAGEHFALLSRLAGRAERLVLHAGSDILTSDQRLRELLS